MKKSISARYLTEQEYDRWNRIVETSAHGSIYSTPEYLGALCEATGGRFRIMACFAGEEIAGGVGLYESDWTLGTYVSNRLLLYYNGIVLRDSNSHHLYRQTSRNVEIMSVLEKALSETRYSRLLFHNRNHLADVRPFLQQGWSARPSYTYIVPLADPESLWGRMEQNLRRLVTRCEDKGVTLSADDDFDSLYRMHEETHHRKGAPIYLPHRSFKCYFERLKAQGLCELYHARLPDGRPIASQLVLLGNHPVSHTVCAAADSDYLNIGSTPFLRWKVFEDLAEREYAANDLTDAALNPVTRFKGQLGGDLKMNLVLQRRDSTAFRAKESAARFAELGRAAIGRLLRPIRNRSEDG